MVTRIGAPPANEFQPIRTWTCFCAAAGSAVDTANAASIDLNSNLLIATSLVPCSLSCLVTQQQPDLVGQPMKLGVRADLRVAWSGERHDDLAPNPPGPGAHDDHAVGEIDRLVDGMGDVDDGLGPL